MSVVVICSFMFCFWFRCVCDLVACFIPCEFPFLPCRFVVWVLPVLALFVCCLILLLFVVLVLVFWLFRMLNVWCGGVCAVALL